MTPQNDFLAALAKQCSDLRIRVAEEYESSIGVLNLRLQSVSAENDELRMQVKGLLSSTRTAQERSKESSDATRGGEDEAVLLLGKEVQMPVPTCAWEPRTSAPTMMMSDAASTKMHMEDVNDSGNLSGVAGANATSKYGHVVETAREISIPGCITSAQGVVGTPAPCSSDAKASGAGPSINVINMSEQAIKSSESERVDATPSKPLLNSCLQAPRSSQDRLLNMADARRRVSLDSKNASDDDEEQANVFDSFVQQAKDKSTSKKSQSSKHKEQKRDASKESKKSQGNEEHASALEGPASGNKAGDQTDKVWPAFQSKEEQHDNDHDNEEASEERESSEDGDSCSSSSSSDGKESDPNSSDDGEHYALAAIWVQQNSDSAAMGIRSSRGIVGSLTSRVKEEAQEANRQSIDFDVTLTQETKVVPSPFVRFVQSRLMLNPYSRQHVTWEGIGLLLLIYDMAVVPLAIFDAEETDFTVFMTWLVRAFWTLDIALSYLTGYLDHEGMTVMNLHKVARNYSRTQLPLDVIVVIFDWLDAFIGVRATGVMKGGRFLRIMRLVRMRKARQLWLKLSEFVNADKAMVFLKTGKNLSILVVLLHFVACTWWGVGLIDVDSGNSWIAKGGFLHLGLGEKYVLSAHMGLANFYGQHYHYPESVAESIWSLVLLFFAFICQMWMVSSITTAMTHLEIMSSKRTHMFTALEKFMTTHLVTRELRLKVHRSARYALLTKEQNMIESDIELLQLISQPMLVRLHVQMYAPILRAAPFLRCFMLADGAAGRQLCHGAVTVDQCHKDDVIFSLQEKPVSGKVRFASGGQIHYAGGHYANGSKVLINRTISHHDWLSENVLWTDDWCHRGTARATGDCQVTCLDAEMFRKLVGSQSTGAAVRVYARLRLNQINGEPDLVSDVGFCDADMDRILGLVFPDIWPTVSHEFLDENADGATVGAKLRKSSVVGAKLRKSSVLLGRYSTIGVPQ